MVAEPGRGPVYLAEKAVDRLPASLGALERGEIDLATVADRRAGVLPDVRRTDYRPPAALQDFAQARDKTCVFPGCSMSAHRADIDRTTVFPDGPTSPENLGVMRRAHHRLKQDRRWLVFQPSPGRFEWTTPSNRTYIREPVAA